MSEHQHHGHSHGAHGPRSARTAKDPVCGMTVDPAHRQAPPCAQWPALLFLRRPVPGEVRGRSRANISIAEARAAAEPVAGRYHLHLPDASRDPAGRPRRLSDLRHGAGAGAGHRGCRPQSRARRHDAALLDRPGAGRAGVRPGDGRPPARPASLDRPADVELGAARCWRRRWCCGRAGRSSSAAGHRSGRATSTCSR